MRKSGRGGRAGGGAKRVSLGAWTSVRSLLGRGGAGKQQQQQQQVAEEVVRDQWAELQEVQEAVEFYPKPLPDDTALIRWKGYDPEVRMRLLTGMALNEQADLATESDTVHVYVSSTFTDFKFERDLYFGLLVPRIREYCRRHQLNFQSIDTRWSFRGRKHETREARLLELHRCKTDSFAFNMLGLLGNRLGLSPLPRNIAPEVFEALVRHAFDASVLQTWFELDTNALPPVYQLLPISKVIPNYSADGTDTRYADLWGNGESVRQCIRQAASAAHQAGELEDDRFEQLFRSKVEEEILEGVLSQNDKHQTHVVMRNLRGVNSEENAQYVDVFDDVAQARLEELKNAVRDEVHENHRSSYEVDFLHGINPVKHKAHREYLFALLTNLEEQIISSVRRRNVQGRYRRDPLITVVTQHLNWVVGRAKDFVGREDLVKSIENNKSRLVFVEGGSGSGKSTTLSHIALRIAARGAKRDVNPVLVVRCVGAEASTDTSLGLLRSVALQILRAYGGDMSMPDSMQGLREAFPRLLSYASDEQPLVLILDGIDHLLDDDLAWIPDTAKEVPAHVRIICSARSKSVAAKRFAESAGLSHIHMPNFSLDEASEMLGYWLQAESRALSNKQSEALLGVVERAQSKASPLMTRLLFEISRKWTSSDPVPAEITEVRTIEGTVELVLRALEATHGVQFVQMALAFVTVADSGISTDELEDLLSLQDALLATVYTTFFPPLARFPSFMVAKLWRDLRPYLSPEGGWYHKEFHAAASKRYAGLLTTCYQTMAQYFSGSPESLVRPKFKIKVKGETWLLSSNRFPAPQPFRFATGSINLRKLAELPAALLATGDTDAFDELMLNVEYIRCSMEADQPSEILFWLRKSTSVTCIKLAQIIAESLESLRKYPDNIEEILWNRLCPILGKDNPFVIKLASARKELPGLHALRPALALAVGSTKQKSIKGHSEPIAAVSVFLDGKTGLTHTVTAAGDGVKMWNGETNQLIGNLLMDNAPIHIQAFSNHRDEAFLACGGKGGSLEIWSLDDSEKCGETAKVHGGAEITALEIVDGGTEAVRVASGGADGSVRILNALSGRVMQSLGGRDRGSAPVRALHATLDASDGKGWLLFVVLESEIQVWNLRLKGIVATLAGAGLTFDGAATFLNPSTFATQVLTFSSHSHTLDVFDLKSAKVVAQLSDEEHFNEGFSAIDVFSETDQEGGELLRCVTGDADGFIKLWDLDNMTLIHTEEAQKGPITDLAVFEDGDKEAKVVSTNKTGTITLWSPSGVVGLDLAVDVARASGPVNRVESFRTKDAWYIVSASDSNLSLWDPIKHTVIETWSGTRAINDISAFAKPRSSDAYCAAACEGGTVLLWTIPIRTRRDRDPQDEEDAEAVMMWDNCHDGDVAAVKIYASPKFAEDDLVVVSGGVDGLIKLWMLRTGAILFSWQAHGGTAVLDLDVALSSGFPQLVTLGGDQKLLVWDFEGSPAAAKKKRGNTLKRRKAKKKQLPEHFEIEHGNTPTAVRAFTEIISKQTKVLVCEDQKPEIRIVGLDGTERKLRGHKKPVTFITAFPDPGDNIERVVTASFKAIRVWNATDSTIDASFRFDQTILSIGAQRDMDKAYVYVGLEDGRVVVLRYFSRSSEAA
ncbi:NACHT domain- and WD repeat-containing protein 1 [Durusdinium trenchii]|uniref:NACHT domain- and WD repeat-containing protein 1 n=1 Tax=Durusdinium trenchii TaxID=1381693 RepID=A0ABP0RXV4_9DINO